MSPNVFKLVKYLEIFGWKINSKFITILYIFFVRDFFFRNTKISGSCEAENHIIM